MRIDAVELAIKHSPERHSAGVPLLRTEWTIHVANFVRVLSRVEVELIIHRARFTPMSPATSAHPLMVIAKGSLDGLSLAG
jgi:hypothetical protein